MTIDAIIDDLIYLYDNSEQAETNFHGWYFGEALPSYGNAAQFKRAKQRYRHFLPQYYRVKIGLVSCNISKCDQTIDWDDWLDYEGECERCHGKALGVYPKHPRLKDKYDRRY
jgi:hypothetical protein